MADEPRWRRWRHERVRVGRRWRRRRSASLHGSPWRRRRAVRVPTQHVASCGWRRARQPTLDVQHGPTADDEAGQYQSTFDGRRFAPERFAAFDAPRWRPGTRPGTTRPGSGSIAGTRPTTPRRLVRRHRRDRVEVVGFPETSGRIVRASAGRPSTLPAGPGTGGSVANRPGVGPGRPSTLPGRPGTGGSVGNRPGAGGGDRPSLGNIAGNRPGVGDRPGATARRSACDAAWTAW